MFKPVTSKLDDVVASNLWARPKKQPARRKKAKLEEIDYFPDVDPFEDMDVEGLFDEAVPPKAEKQISAAARGQINTYQELHVFFAPQDNNKYRIRCFSRSVSQFSSAKEERGNGPPHPPSCGKIGVTRVQAIAS